MGRPLKMLLVDVNRTALDTNIDMIEYPIGLIYVGTAVKNAFGDEVDIRIESYDEKTRPLAYVEDLLADYQPHILGLRALTMARQPLHEIGRLAKRRFAVPLVLAGGPHASDNPGDIASDTAFDCVVIGEGELTATELVGRALAGESLQGIPGTAYRQDGEVRLGPARPLIEPLDDIPIPDYGLIDFLAINRGHMDFSVRRDVKHANLVTSRGCPFGCLYCHQIFGRRMRAHSPERIVEEIRVLNEHYGVRNFQIIDDIFNLDRQRAMRFYELIVAGGLDVVFSFPNGLRGDMVDAEMVDAMWEAGVRYACYAVETGSSRLQKLIHKHMKLDRIQEAITLSTAKGILTKGFFMLGFPTETEEEALMTIEFAKQSDLTQALFFTVVYFPGTALYRLAETVCDMSAYELAVEDDYILPREGPYAFTRDRLEEIKRLAVREFFFSRERVERAFTLMPTFFDRRDIDASFLATIISGQLSEEDVVDPEVASRLHRYFLIADRFSQRKGFFV